MTELKLTDPNWMFWRVLRGDRVRLERANDTYDSQQLDMPEEERDRLSRHPFNLLQGLFIGYMGLYKINPEGWIRTSRKGIEKKIDHAVFYVIGI